MPPTIPINHYFGPRNQQNRTQVLFHYSMLMYSKAVACFKHSNLFKVKGPNSYAHPVKGKRRRTPTRRACTHPCRPKKGRRADGLSRSTTSFLTATTLIYAIGAGITAAAGTRLALQWILVKDFKLYSFQLQDSMGPVLLFIVTTSLSQDWVICAPAAFLGCGSRFSGSLSGIEP